MGLSTQQFFALLQAGLWNRPVDLSLFRKPVDWPAIYKMALRHTVLAVVADGMNQLPKELLPSQTLLQQWIMQVFGIEQRNRQMNALLPRLFKLFEDAGIRVFLLKGQGIARLYPNPLHRQCGDIDLFVEKKDLETAKNLLAKHTSLAERERQDYIFHFQNILIELHSEINVQISYKLSHHHDCWIKERLLDAPPLVWGNTHLPSANFDALFIFIHFFRHLMISGIGLRQLCDWARYLYKQQEHINMEMLQKDLERSGIGGAWNVFGHFIARYLGFPGNKEFFTKDVDDKVLAFVLNDIMGDKNRIKRKEPSNLLLRKINSIFTLLPYRCRFFRIFPTETLYSIHCFFREGFKYMVKGNTSSLQQ